MIKLVDGDVLILNGREIITEKNAFKSAVKSKLGKDFSLDDAKRNDGLQNFGLAQQVGAR